MTGLKRTLGLPMLTFYGTGMILGAGVYSVIGQAAGGAGYSLWISFTLAALAALLTALSYAELATMFPKAGGEYVYLRHAFPQSRWIAATVGIFVIFSGCATVATVALAFTGYMVDFVAVPRWLTAAFLVLFFTGLNIIGIRQSSWTNAILTVIEGSGLILFIWLGWQEPTFGEALNASPSAATISSAALIIFAFLGFENIVNFAEETKQPEKNIPRAILLSLAISTVLYILVSLAAVALMSPDQLVQTDSALAAAAALSSKRIAVILGAVALFSTANTALIGLITTSRIIYGVANDGSLPRFMATTLKKRKSPWVAALVTLFITLVLISIDSIARLASIASFAIMTAFIAVNVALIVLRASHPELHRPFRIPFALAKIPLSPILAIATCSVFLVQFDRTVYLISGAALLISFTIHLLFRHDSKSSFE